jgi:hypothetical protein
MSMPLVTFEDNNQYRIMTKASCGHREDQYLNEEPSPEEVELINKEINSTICKNCQKNVNNIGEGK